MTVTVDSHQVRKFKVKIVWPGLCDCDCVCEGQETVTEIVWPGYVTVTVTVTEIVWPGYVTVSPTVTVNSPNMAPDVFTKDWADFTPGPQAFARFLQPEFCQISCGQNWSCVCFCHQPDDWVAEKLVPSCICNNLWLCKFLWIIQQLLGSRALDVNICKLLMCK